MVWGPVVREMFNAVPHVQMFNASKCSMQYRMSITGVLSTVVSDAIDAVLAASVVASGST